MMPSKKQWASWSMPNKLTLVGTYTGILGVVLSIIFFYLSNGDNRPAETELDNSTKGNIHITGLMDHDKYLDEAMLVFPKDITNSPGLHLRLSEDIKSRSYEDENVDFSYFTETMAINQIGMSWEEEISMRFDSKNNGLIFNSSQTNDNTVKEKEVILHILKDLPLPYVKSYSMKVNNGVLCDIDYHAGYGIKDNVRFQVTKQTPLFVWDSSSIPKDCK